MTIDVNASSNTGIVREQNEDMILVASRFVRDASYAIQINLKDKERCIFAVADGMGGHNAGEVASEETLLDLSGFFYALPSGLLSTDLKAAFCRWIQHIHVELNRMGCANPEYRGMGTTLVGLCIYEEHIFWFNCGDSRLYCLHDNKLSQISVDHSYERETGLKGYSNILTNCVGAGEGVYIDMYEITNTVVAGDLFLLCSDGLSNIIGDSQIERFLNADFTASQFVKVACNGGGYDNISVCLLRFKEKK